MPKRFLMFGRESSTGTGGPAPTKFYPVYSPDDLCDACGGDGFVDDDEVCPQCLGTGLKEE